MPIVVIPNAFRGTTQGAAEVEVPAGTIRACLDSVSAEAPGFQELVFDKAGNPQRWMKFFLNEVQLEDGPALLDTEVGENDRLELLAAVAGG